MRNNIKYLLVWFLCIFTIQATFGQDAIVIGFNFDSPDGASVLALKDIPETQNIFVTETNYDAATNTFDRTDAINNGTVRITWTGTWAKGTIIEFTETSSNVLTTTPGPGAPADAEEPCSACKSRPLSLPAVPFPAAGRPGRACGRA